MTINVSLIMMPFPPIVILNGANIPYRKDGKRDSDTEWRICYSEWSPPVNTAFCTRIMEPAARRSCWRT